jgi:hypothetical protein
MKKVLLDIFAVATLAVSLYAGVITGSEINGTKLIAIIAMEISK